MAVPKAAIDYYNRLDRLGVRAKRSAYRAWRSVDRDNIRDSWLEASRSLTVSVTAGQVEAATLGASYGAQTLAAQGFYTPPDEWVNPRAFGGFSPNGVPAREALQAPASRALHDLGRGRTIDQAMRSGQLLVGALVATMVTEAGRSAAGVDTFARPRVGYVRMVNPGACDRCIILAGKVYSNNEGFLRHPNCYCIHVQTNTKAAEDEGLIADPYEYFKSLSEEEQDERFTKAGAQAIRDGADIFQVVNARRGMSYPGMSVDGSFRGQRATGITTAGSTHRAHTGGIRNRLTPDAIYQQGLPRDRTLQLLREQGYLLPQGQDAAGVIRGAGIGAGKPGDLTAAQKRVQRATLQWEAVKQGRNPYDGRKPLTPQVAADVEDNYRRWVATAGQIYTR
ncbi:MAG TPA: hypothetical protein VIG71_10750 [Enteractinococcus sp.]